MCTMYLRYQKHQAKATVLLLIVVSLPGTPLTTPVNEVSKKCSYLGFNDLVKMLVKGDFITAIDIEDAYRTTILRTTPGRLCNGTGMMVQGLWFSLTTAFVRAYRPAPTS